MQVERRKFNTKYFIRYSVAVKIAKQFLLRIKSMN